MSGHAEHLGPEGGEVWEGLADRGHVRAPRCRARPARGRRRPSPCGGRRSCRRPAAAARSGRGLMDSPSGISVTSPPSALISLAMAASRSVSCARVWPTPVITDGPDASAASEVSGRHSSGMSRRSASMPWIVPVPLTVRPSGPSEHVAPMRLSTSHDGACRAAGCRLASRDGDRPAGDQRRREERAGVGQVGLDGEIAEAERPRVDPPDGRPRPGSRPRRPPQRRGACGRSSRCAAATAPAGPRAAPRRPSSKRGAASSSPETSCDEPEASSVTVAAAQRRRCRATVNGRQPRPPSSIDAPSARRAASSAPTGRSRARGSPSKCTAVGRQRRDRRQEPHHGAGVAHVDGQRRAGDRVSLGRWRRPFRAHEWSIPGRAAPLRPAAVARLQRAAHDGTVHRSARRARGRGW